MFPAPMRAARPARRMAAQSAVRPSARDRLRAQVAALGLLIGLATTGLAAVPEAASAAPGSYSASISPNVAQAGSSSTFMVTFTNGPTTRKIKKAVINVPGGFALTSVGAPSPSSLTVARSGNEITLSGLLRPGASVSIPITATAATTPGSYTVVTKASGPAGTFTNTGPAVSVKVAQAAAVAPCNPNMPCSTPTLAVGPAQNFLATGSQVTAQSGPQADQLTVVLPDPTAAPVLCQQTNGNFGQIVTWAVTSRASTLVYTVHPTTIGYTYGLSDTCFGSTQPFPGAVQNPANGNEFEGTLPYCSVPNEPSQTNPPPCVRSIVTVRQPTDPPAVQVTISAPLGDPKFSG